MRPINIIRAVNDRPHIMLSDIGNVAEASIQAIEKIYSNVVVDKYVIMPNHMHMLIAIDNRCGRSVNAPTVSTIIKHLKGFITRVIKTPIWQKSFYDRIVRNDVEYAKIWDYIDTNPDNWPQDEYCKNKSD